MHAEIGGLMKLNYTDKVNIVGTPLVRKINPWYAEVAPPTSSGLV